MVKKFHYKNRKDKNQRFFHYNSSTKNRKGLSTIVVTLILVALSMAAIVLVWGFVNNLLKKQIHSSESCFGNAEKITINRQYTCYEQTGSNYKLRFSLSVGDINVSKIVVSVSSGGSVKSYNIVNGTVITNLAMYSGVNPSTILLPFENAGLTYNATGFTSKIDSIQIAPVISGTQCEVSDALSEIENCIFMT